MSQSTLHKFTGTHYDIGRQQGITFQTTIHEAWRAIQQYDLILALKPRFIPRNLFFAIAKRKGYNLLADLLQKYCPGQAERIAGIADGAGIDVKILYLIASMEIILGVNDYEIPLRGGCTDVAVAKEKTESGDVLFMRNFDFMRFVVPYLRVRSSAPEGRLKSIDIALHAFPGTFNGMNEAGVAMGTNEVFPLGVERSPGLPASILIQEALETCRNTQEVVELFRKLPRGSCNKILVADASGNFVAIEYTPQQLEAISSTKPFLVATNHYIAPELAKIDMPKTAVFGSKAPAPLRGHNIQETSFFRLATAENFVRSAGLVNENWLQRLAACHFVDGAHQDEWDTICHHDPVNITATSMIFNLSRRTMQACFGNPCEGSFREFDPDWN
ncbi:MAG TPA: C45 family peptidase [Candidatus Lokiarchaeia archaeon]|nr:C45 family peptidase [Candidatus Lokiarchaeia archaeon]